MVLVPGRVNKSIRENSDIRTQQAKGPIGLGTSASRKDLAPFAQCVPVHAFNFHPDASKNNAPRLGLESPRVQGMKSSVREDGAILATDFSQRLIDVCLKNKGRYKWPWNYKGALRRLNKEALNWLKANIEEGHSLEELPFDDLESPAKLVFFIQQLAVFRGESIEKTLSQTQWYMGHAIQLTYADTAFLDAIFTVAQSYHKVYPDTERKLPYREWFQTWHDLAGVLKPHTFNLDDPEKFVRGFEAVKEIVDILTDVSATFVPRAVDLKYYWLFRKEELYYFLSFLEEEFPQVPIRLPKTVFNDTALMRPFGIRTGDPKTSRSSWDNLHTLAESFFLENAQNQDAVSDFVTKLYRWTNQKSLPFDALRLTGLPAGVEGKNLHSDSSPKRVLDFDVFTQWSKILNDSSDWTPDEIVNFGNMLHWLQHSSGAKKEAALIYRRVYELTQLLGRKIEQSELSYIYELYYRAQQDSGNQSSTVFDAALFDGFMDTLIQQIRKLKNKSPVLIHRYLIQDFDLVLCSADYALDVLNNSYESLAAEDFFKSQRRDVQKRSDANAIYDELLFSEALQSGRLSEGAKLRLVYLYRLLSQRGLDAFVVEGLALMDETKAFDEAEGEIVFHHGVGPNDGSRIGLKSLSSVRLMDDSVVSSFRRGYWPHHLRVHFHPLPRFKDSVGRTTGPSSGYNIGFGLAVDRGHALQTGASSLVLTRLEDENSVNIDYYDHTGIVIDLGVIKVHKD